MPGKGRPAGVMPTMKMSIAIPTHANVKGVVDLLAKEKGRMVTFSEAIDTMYAAWLAARRNGTA